MDYGNTKTMHTGNKTQKKTGQAECILLTVFLRLSFILNIAVHPVKKMVGSDVDTCGVNDVGWV